MIAAACALEEYFELLSWRTTMIYFTSKRGQSGERATNDTGASGGIAAKGAGNSLS